MDKITRRSALAVTGAGLTAALTGVSTSVAAAEKEHPWVKARRLAYELSETLAEGDGAWTGPGGEWYAEVQPAGRNFPFLFGNIMAREEYARVVSLPCRDVIEAHRKAREVFCAACDGVDRIALGHEPSKAARRRYDKANQAEEDALVAVCAFHPTGSSDARAKVDYLMPFVQGGELYEHHITALVNSMVRS